MRTTAPRMLLLLALLSLVLLPALVLLSLSQVDAQSDQASINDTRATATEALITPLETCSQPGNALNNWWHNAWTDGPHYCTNKGDNRKWAMLRAYRSGGQEGTHWTYVDSGDESRCLTNWGYYTSDGQTLQATIPRATTMGDNRRWCALPVYRPGGVQGKQWQYCDCKRPISMRPTPPPTNWR